MEHWDSYYAQKKQAQPDAYDGWLDGSPHLPAPGGRVLDLGCGCTGNTAALLEQGFLVTACDFSPQAIESAKARHPQIDTACFDMRTPFPFADRSFDAVVADLSLHYFTWAETERIISEIRRILTDGGRLLARVHSVANVNPEGLVQLEPNYYISGGYPRRYFTAPDLEALFDRWRLFSVRETEIFRYRQIKHVLEFYAGKQEP